jgi:excisionase family DNA binding protein
MIAAAAPAPEPFKSVATAAREVGVSYKTLYRLARTRRVPTVRIGDRVNVRLSDVRQAIQEIPAIV